MNYEILESNGSGQVDASYGPFSTLKEAIDCFIASGFTAGAGTFTIVNEAGNDVTPDYLDNESVTY